MELTFLQQISNSMNYQCYHSEPPLYQVQDHRAVIPVAWAAHKDEVFTEPPLLIRFDAHLDMAAIGTPLASNDVKVIDDFGSIDEVLTYSNKEMRSDDGDWVLYAMEMGLAGDVITFYLNDDNRSNGVTEHTDHLGHNHKIFNFGRISSLLSHMGNLVDTARSSDFKPLWDTLNWDPSYGWPDEDEKWKDIWFDIDLDFAIHNLGNDFGGMAWREQDFFDEFVKPVQIPLHHDYKESTVELFVHDMLMHAKLFSLATEPSFSCGLEGVSHILTELNYVFGKYGDWFSLPLRNSGNVR